jgi:hypothetical protein
VWKRNKSVTRSWLHVLMWLQFCIIQVFHSIISEGKWFCFTLNCIESHNLNKNFIYRTGVLTVMVVKRTMFWDVMPCSLLKIIWHFGVVYRLHLRGWINQARKQRENPCLSSVFMLVSCLNFLTLKMERIYSSETSFDCQWFTWRYIPGDSTLQEFSLS